MKINPPNRASPPRTPMTIPAIEPPLRPESSLALALEVSAPAVGLDPATVMVLTCPPEVVSLTMLPDVVVVEDDELVCDHRLATRESNCFCHKVVGKYSGCIMRGSGYTCRCTASGSLSQQRIREPFPKNKDRTSRYEPDREPRRVMST